MSVSAPFGSGFDAIRDLGAKAADAAEEAVKAAAAAPAAALRGLAPARPVIGAAPAAPSGDAALRQVYDRSERTLNALAKAFGGKDRELDELSEKATRLRERAFADKALTPAEAADLRAQLDLILSAYAEAATRRGYPPGALKPASPQQFAVLEEQQQIHFQWLAGKDLRSGALGETVKALKAPGARADSAAAQALAKQIAFDIATSPSKEVATDKVRLLRAELSKVPDRGLQTAFLARVGAELDATVRALGGATPLSRADFDAAARFESSVSVHETPLPDEVRGTGRIFPNKPIPGWEATTRAATKASLDDMQAAGKLFLDKVPPGGPPKTVAIKLDMNLGADGPPSVSDPAATNATISELLERAKKDGKNIRFTVGDSCGGENIAVGRTTMDIMRDTGNYHHALKAGLAFAAKEGDAAAAAALRKIEDAERRGVYFGGKDDQVSSAADLTAAEAAAAKYVTCVDYDAAGYVSIDPKLGPLGQAAWGAREFQVAKPWVEADYRVHVARGASNHFLANWTGATKGLIGLHAFGLRPADQGANKLGVHPIDALPLLTQNSGMLAVFQRRTGVTDVVNRIMSSGDPKLVSAFRAVQAKWDGLHGNARAWGAMSDELRALHARLKKDQAAGMSEPELMEKMRLGVRAALESADKVAPGFKQMYWDTTHEATRVAMVAGWRIRGVAPDEISDERLGARIGLLASLPYQSDLVIQTQPKVGLGGGPDAYGEVKDVGVIIAGTDEASTDAMAWRRAGRKDSLWEENYPVHAALRYGRGPMHHDEVRDATRPR
jgi:hypothetical protein